MHGILGLKRILLALLFALSGAVASAEKRVALVIGNSAYQHTGALPNPLNDANDLTAALEKLGFQVIKATDLDKRGMDRAISSFARAATDADAALFFYAGHGMQFQGSNYLMPVDAKLEDEVTLTFEMTRVDDVISAISRARGVKMLLLDACRDNPLAKQLASRATTRSLGPTRGLAKIERTQGTLIAFATQANDVAIDGVGSRNSPFTTAILKDIATPNLEVGTLFRRVAAEVNRLTDGRQTPELSVSILGEFYFHKVDADADRLAREQAEARRKLTVELEEQQRLARETAARVREENDRLIKELADRERRAREQLERLAAPVPPATPVAPTPAPAAPAAPTLAPIAPLAVVAPPAPTPAPAVPVIPELTGAPLVRALKEELKRVGCYAGPLDAAWPTKAGDKALADYHQHAGKVAVPLSAELLATVKTHPDRVCPLTCAKGQEPRGGVCVAVVAPVAPKPVRPDVVPRPRRPVAKPVIQPRPAPVVQPRPRLVRPAPEPAERRRFVRPTPTPRHVVENPAPARPAFKRCFHIGGLSARVEPMCE